MNSIYPQYIEEYPNERTRFHYDDLYKLAFSCFDLENLPLGWDNGYIKSAILTYGFIGVYTNTIIGKVPVVSYIREFNYMYRPAVLAYSNYVLGEGEGRIGINSEIIYSNYQLTPISYIAGYYAKILANIDASLYANIFNTRVANILYADGEAEKNTMQSLYDNITEGNPAIVVSKKYKDVLESRVVDVNNAKQTYIGDLLNEAYRNIKNRYLTSIGIPNTSFEKSERLTQSEATSNNSEVHVVNSYMIDSLESCIDRVNRLCGSKIKVVNKVEEVISNVSTQLFSNDNNSNARGAELDTV